MSLAKPSRSSKKESKFVSCIWKVFPHVFLIVSLIAYAALGAVVFYYIESGNVPPREEYHSFLGDIVEAIQNYSGNTSVTQQDIVEHIEKDIRKRFKSTWLQYPERWTFFGALFFCCTVFTTVGYGEIYPMTLTGKVVCILYAMVGIPLMLLVITDVGDILAVLLSKAYFHLHRLCKLLLYRTWSPKQTEAKPAEAAIQEGSYIFNQDVVVHTPMDIRQLLHNQAEVKRKSINLRNNTEIFERIIIKENLARQNPLMRSLSCPELNRTPRLPKGFVIWDFTGIGESMDQLDVPLLLILIVVFAYILFGGLILPLWETDLNNFDAFYFCFITLTTIGFGDIVPNHPKYFMVTFLFIITGMATMSMAFKLGQSRIVSCYRQCMHRITWGRYEAVESD